MRVTEEDEYFPPPPELRELVPALDAAGRVRVRRRSRRGRARSAAASPATATPTPPRCSPASTADGSTAIGRLLSGRRGPASRRSYASSNSPLQRVGERSPSARRPGRAAPARRRGASGSIGSPTTIATRPKRGIGDLCDRRISSVPAMPTRHDRNAGAQREVRGAGLERLDLRAVLAGPLGVHAQHLARLEHRRPNRAPPCGRCRRARPESHRAPEQRAEHGHPEQRRLAHEADPPARDRRRERDVHHRTVRRGEHEATRRGNVLQPDDRGRGTARRGMPGHERAHEPVEQHQAIPAARARSTSSCDDLVDRRGRSCRPRSRRRPARSGETTPAAVERVAPRRGRLAPSSTSTVARRRRLVVLAPAARAPRRSRSGTPSPVRRGTRPSRCRAPRPLPPPCSPNPRALPRDEHRAHRRVGRDGRDRGRHLGARGSRRSRRGRRSSSRADRRRPCARSRSARTPARRRGRRRASSTASVDRPVHRAGVEHLAAERGTRRPARWSTCPSPTGRRSRRRLAVVGATSAAHRRRHPSSRARSSANSGYDDDDRRPAPHRALAVDRVGRDRRGHRDAVVAVALERRRPAARPPRIDSPSARVSTATPSCRQLLSTVPMRSLSFTASSAASRISVTPSANAAATASAGISSCTLGISSPAIVGGRERARRGRGSRRPVRRSAPPVSTTLDVGAHAPQHVDEPQPRRVERSPTRS